MLWIFGPIIYRLWIRQRVAFDAECFHILLIVVVVNSLWSASSVIPMSVNSHCRLATIYAGVALASLGLACVLTPLLGTVGSAFALLLGDTWMAVIALRTAFQQVGDDSKSFAAALFALPRLRQVPAIAPPA